MRKLVLLFVATSLVPSAAIADTPPPGSPAAQGQWPRLIVTSQNRQAIRSYVDTHYRPQFQAFLNLLGNAASVQDNLEGVWAPMNFAFPVALGVTELKSLGYSFPAAYDTDAKLCAEAYEYATAPTGGFVSQIDQLRNSVSYDNNASMGNYPNRASITDFIVPAMLMYDWCHASLSTAQKGVIADAFYEQYDENYDAAALSPKTLLNAGQGQTLSNRFDGVWSSLLFGLTSWGDTDVLDSTKRQALYDAFYALYINRYIWEIDWSNAKAGFREGMDYWSHTNAVIAPYEIAMIDSALGTTYAADRPFFSKRNELLAAWTYPDAIGRGVECGTGGTSRCTPYVQPWGNNSVTQTSIKGLSLTHNVSMTIGFSRFMGFTADANIGRWIWNNLVVNTNPTWASSDTPTSGLYANSPWAYYVFYLFLFGIEGTTATEPTATTVPVMWDYSIFRSGYTQDASHVFFGASTHHSSGHESQENGSFSLFKKGNLIVPGPQYRGNGCNVTTNGTPGSLNIFRNQVGIHSGTSDTSLGYDVSVADPAWAARGLSAYMNGPIALPPRSSNGSYYSYVHYDMDPAWSEATTMQREFTYMRGTTDHEYLVILDRANVSNVENDPIWKIWVPRQPACVDSPCIAGRGGQWTTQGKVLSVTNQHAAMTSAKGWVLAPTNGKFFLKTLLPADGRFNILGDDGTFTKMYQTGNNDGTVFPFSGDNNPVVCDLGAQDLFGWGRIEVRPAATQQTNTFLNVIQFGDANTPTTMAAADVVDSEDGRFVVSRIADTQRNRLVVFGKNVDASVNAAGLSYRYVPTTAGSDHVIVNLATATTYYVSVSGTSTITIDVSQANNGGTAWRTDEAGVLAFQLGAALGAAPGAPRNLRIY